MASKEYMLFVNDLETHLGITLSKREFENGYLIWECAIKHAESLKPSPNTDKPKCCHLHHSHDMGSIICLDCNDVLTQ